MSRQATPPTGIHAQAQVATGLMHSGAAIAAVFAGDLITLFVTVLEPPYDYKSLCCLARGEANMKPHTGAEGGTLQKQ